MAELNYTIVVNDAGELKSVTATEIGEHSIAYATVLDNLLNEILDKRAIADGIHTPEGT